LGSLIQGARLDMLHPALWCGGWQALLWSLVDEWVSGGPGVRSGCYVVSCRWQLKYIIRDMYNCHYLCHRSPSGRQVAANLVDLFEL